MVYRVRMFGMAREIAGSSWVELETDLETVTVGQLKQSLMKKFPELESMLTYEIAVNHEYADDSLAIVPNDELAVIPPVSGG